MVPRLTLKIENDNIANQIHGFTIDYGKFILTSNRPQVSMGYKLINHTGCW